MTFLDKWWRWFERLYLAGWSGYACLLFAVVVSGFDLKEGHLALAVAVGFAPLAVAGLAALVHGEPDA